MRGNKITFLSTKAGTSSDIKDNNAIMYSMLFIALPRRNYCHIILWLFNTGILNNIY